MKFFRNHITQYQHLDDHELVKLYRDENDEKAFSELMNRHQNKVYSYILSMIGNTEVASDIFQDTFTKVITKLDATYNEQGKFIAWVMRIAHNATIDHIRKHKRFVDVSAYDDEDRKTDYYNRLPDEGSKSQDEELSFEQDKKSLMKHISNLPDEQKQVVMMRHYYELSFKEIADITGVSINTALGRMRYALINLRKMFDQERQNETAYANN
jgi:RNA polymerase sigma-70 factor (ECF subfamily)